MPIANACTDMPNAKRRKYNVTRRRAHKNKASINKRYNLMSKKQTVLSGTANIIGLSALSCSLYKLKVKYPQLNPTQVHDAIEIPPDSIMFDRSEFDRWNEIHGPFTLDGAASMYDCLVPNFCSIERPFENEKIQGQNVFLNPPFGKAETMLKHFESERQKSPLDTKALIVLPQWTSKFAKTLKYISDKYQRIHTYPAGTYLFHEPSKTGSVPLGPTPWPVDLFLADESVEQKAKQSYESAKLTAHLKSVLVFNKNFGSDKVFKPAPKDRCFIHQLSSNSPGELLIVQPFLNNDKSSKMTSLIDSGATMDFIDNEFVKKHEFPQVQLQDKLRIVLADGRESITSSAVWLSFSLAEQPFHRKFLVTDLQSEFDSILGMSFLKDTNPDIDWQNGTIRFSSSAHPISAVVAQKPVALNFINPRGMSKSILKDFGNLANSHTKYFVVSLRCHSNDSISLPYADSDFTIPNVVSDQDSEFDAKLQKLLSKHHKILQQLNELPPSRPGFDHTIDTFPDSDVPTGKVYRMSPLETNELKRQLTEYIEKGWIRISTSEYAAPILFAKKADGSLRLCVDYRGLNKITKKVQFPLPNIDTLLDSFAGATVFTALDLAQGYHQLRVSEKDIHKTAFKTQFGLFEFCVMPFGLTNAPATFQRVMTHILQPHNNPFVLVYLDDILIFSRTKEEHLQHLETVFSLLAKHDFRLRIDKCFFAKNKLNYLGHTISSDGLQPESSKIEAVKSWPKPQSVVQVQQFLGFCNFYRRYVKNFSQVAEPLYALTRKTSSGFVWSAKCNAAFEMLKQKLCSAPVLLVPTTGPSSHFVVSTDASKYALGAVLLQKDNTGKLRPCAYYAKTLKPEQTRYPTYDLEMLGVVCAVQEWRHYLEGCEKFVVITDHVTLQYLPTQKFVGRRHASWLQLLSPFMSNMEIVYRKGSQNCADALSRRPDLTYLLSTYDENDIDSELENLTTFLNSMFHLQVDNQLLKEIKESYNKDPAFNRSTLPPAATKMPDGLYYVADKIYIPNDSDLHRKIIHEFHNYCGHPSSVRTLANLRKSFFWPAMNKTVKHYCKQCATCQVTKKDPAKPIGSLYPMPVPKRPWEFFSMDFITNLPLVNGYDSICTFVCLFTKQAHFVPCSSNIDAKQLADLYINHVYKYHGLSRVMIGDRDTKFTSEYWRRLFSSFHTKLNLSSAYHPQTDGQTERTHRTIEQILRAFVHRQHSSWLRFLPHAEFSYNNLQHSSTGFSPFEALYGFQPLTPVSLIEPPPSDNSDSHDENLQNIHDVHSLIADNLVVAKEFQKHYANLRTRRSRSFQEGEKVLLSTDNLSLRNSQCRKFKQRYIGPFSVVKKISDQVYQLDLPPELKCHPVFHISKLKIYVQGDDSSPSLQRIPAHYETPPACHTPVSKIIRHGIKPFPERYPNGLSLAFEVQLVDDSSDSPSTCWKPYVELKQLQLFVDYCESNSNLQRFIRSPYYQTLHKQYPSRFPTSLP